MALVVQLAAMAMPEWVVQRAPAVGPSSSPPAMKAHLGLFHVAYRLEDKRQEDNMYGFCNGASPAYSLEKCLTWRTAQATALGSGALSYAALVLLLVAVSGVVKTHALERTLALAWSLSFMSGFMAWSACASFFLLMLAFRKEHRTRKDGYTVEVGYALVALAAVGCVFILLPFIRMLLHKCLAASSAKGGDGARSSKRWAAPVGEESVAPGSYVDEEVVDGLEEVVDDKASPSVRATKRPHHHRQHHPHYPHQHYRHHRRHSRELAEAPAAALASVVVLDAEANAMTT